MSSFSTSKCSLNPMNSGDTQVNAPVYAITISQVEQQCGWDNRNAKNPLTLHKVCLISGLQLIYDHPKVSPWTVINESQTYLRWGWRINRQRRKNLSGKIREVAPEYDFINSVGSSRDCGWCNYNCYIPRRHYNLNTFVAFARSPLIAILGTTINNVP